MNAVLGRAEARAVDQRWIDAGVPGIILMENAGRGAADRIFADVLGGNADPRRVVVLCGPGNNGGDGLVVARRLRTLGVRVRVCLLEDASRYVGAALTNLLAFLALGEDVHREPSLGPDDVVVDALFGTGLTRPLSQAASAFVLATRGHTVVALDMPSGIDADTGQVLGTAMCAKYTYTFGSLKRGLLVDQALPYVGHVFVVDIGVPAPKDARIFALTAADLSASACIRPREPASHKYTSGHVLVLGGSKGTEGAAELVARGALRSGAGLVTRASLGEGGRGLSEVMRTTLPRGSELAEALASLFDKKRAVVVGPGLGRDADAGAIVEAVLRDFRGPVVFDADALRLVPAASFRGDKNVLTPHTGELAHMLGVSIESIDNDRFGAVEQAVAQTGAVVVLKGARTLIGEPGGQVRVCLAGTPALGTAGSGDVLAGIIGALLCSMTAFEAAQSGVLMHALVGEAWASAKGDRGLLASEIADGIPVLLRAIFGS